MKTISIRLLFHICLLSLVAGGCNPTSASVVPSNTQVETATISIPADVPSTTLPTTEPTVVLEPTAKSPGGYRLGYQFDMRINYEGKQVEVDQAITIEELPNAIPNIILVVEPNRYPNGFGLTSLSVNDIGVENYELVANQLKFDLPAAIDQSGLIQIRLLYNLQLPVIPPPSEMYKPQPYGYTDRQLNLVDWFPFIPPLDDNGQWVIHPPHVFGETLVYPLADFEVQLELTGNQTPLTVAASGAGTRTENQYHYKVSKARNFVLSISPDYQMLHTEAAGVTILTYAFSDSTVQNQAVLEYASQALTLYSKLFGPLLRQTVSVVQADFLDGMEFDGLYFVSKGFYNLYDGTVNSYLSLITVHEMAHQWWYGAVGSDQALNPWLDEGLSTFAELQYIEHYYPDQVDWWWGYRVNYYQPDGFIDLPVYDYQFYIGYRNSVYLRSAQFLAALRESVGVDAYNAAIQQYVKTGSLRIARPDDFWAAFAGVPGYPFSELLSVYFHSPIQ